MNPVALESRIQSLNGVVGAIVFGNGRVRCGLIVETKDQRHNIARGCLEYGSEGKMRVCLNMRGSNVL